MRTFLNRKGNERDSNIYQQRALLKGEEGLRNGR